MSYAVVYVQSPSMIHLHWTDLVDVNVMESCACSQTGQYPPRECLQLSSSMAFAHDCPLRMVHRRWASWIQLVSVVLQLGEHSWTDILLTSPAPRLRLAFLG